jgi:hypothetical protein
VKRLEERTDDRDAPIRIKVFQTQLMAIKKWGRGRPVQRDPAIEPGVAATLAHIVSAIMFLSLAATVNIASSVDEILSQISAQVSVLLADAVAS